MPLVRRFPPISETMTRFPNDYFSRVERMMNDLTDRAFGDVFGNSITGKMRDTLEKYSYPKLNILENDEFIEIEAAVPGLTKDDIDVEINDKANEIVLTHNSDAADKRKYCHHEFPIKSKWTRVIGNMDFKKIKTDEITAKVENGVLSIILPLWMVAKEPVETRKRIEIK